MPGVLSLRYAATFLCHDRYFSRPKAETDLRSIASHCVSNEDDDSFSRVVRTYTGVQNQFRIIEPFIEELHDIIESTLGALADRKDYALSGNSRSDYANYLHIKYITV